MSRTPPARIIVVISLVVILTLGTVAGAVAQSDKVLITITRVESQAFPRVTACVAVSDENGPRDGLTAAEFRVFEDGVEVPATAIAVESDASQELRLVLALDLSMNVNSLTQLKEAAKAFIDTLGPPDRVAVIAFYDEVKVVQDFTNNKDVLKAAIDALTPEGNRTALSDAAFEAVSRLSALPTGRKAVVALTNSVDNISTHSPDEVVDQARSAGASIYVIGFDRAQADPLKAMTAGTGGQSFVLPNLKEIQGSFEAIGGLLRRGGYQVTFQSGLKADGAEHDLVVGVRKEGQTEGHFVATPGQVTVSLPGLAEGQRVGGVVDLAVQAIAPASVASVEYRLNDRLLAAVTKPPYGFEWDSTTFAPGAYRLAVKVVDRAGNQGQVQVNLNVVKPLVVTASISQPEVKVGAPVVVTATVEALAAVTRVDFLLDGKLVGSDSTPPYRFSLDSSAYPAGKHLITVQAEDSQGRTAETRLAMQFVAPPVPKPKAFWLSLRERPWLLTMGGVIVVALAAVAVALIGLVMVVKAQKRPKVYHLEIANLGNVPSRYVLRAEEPMDALRFQFALHGVKLPPWPEPQTTEVVTETVAEVPVAPAAPSYSPASPTGAGVGETAGQAMQTGSAVTGALSSVGSVLPGSLGTSFQGVVRPVYRAQSAVSGAKLQAESATSQVSYVSGQAAGARPGPSSPRTAGDSATRSTVKPARSQIASVTPASRLAGETWVQTPVVAPAETLTLDLLITPLNPHRTQRYAFKVVSRAVEQEGAPLVEEGNIQIVGVSWLRRLLPYLMFVVFTGGVVLVAALLLVNLSVWGR